MPEELSATSEHFVEHPILGAILVYLLIVMINFTIWSAMNDRLVFFIVAVVLSFGTFLLARNPLSTTIRRMKQSAGPFRKGSHAARAYNLYNGLIFSAILILMFSFSIMTEIASFYNNDVNII